MQASQEHIDPEVVAAVDKLEFREPVVADDDNRENAESDRQWRLVTEAARQAIENSADVRRAAATFNSQPLDESLPGRALAEFVATDPRTARIIHRSGAALMQKLALDSVPDSAIFPDLRHSRKLEDRDETARLLHKFKSDTETFSPGTYERTLGYVRARQAEGYGITYGEQQLVDRRYRYARDIKLLGLSAELHDHPFTPGTTTDGVLEYALPSGTQLIVTSEAATQTPDLLNPAAWQSRQQIKDRVYNVVVGGREYIMKERKTDRHMDTTKNGHRETLPSEQEFAVAQHFANKGVITRDGIQLRWEKPLGSVTYPDGYQFTLFEKEAGLDKSMPTETLIAAIRKDHEAYQDEFEAVAAEAKRLYDERGDLVKQNVPPPKPKRFPLTRSARAYKKEYNAQPEHDELTFDEFANAKAHSLVRVASEAMRDVMTADGFRNGDSDDYSTRVVEVDGKPSIELITFDMEYYKYDPDEADWLRRNRAQHKNSGDQYVTRYFEQRDIEVAAEYVMLVHEGVKLRDKDH